MPAPVLLLVIGTRSEALACASLAARLRNTDRSSLPFEPRLITTGQEDTELRQTLEAFQLEPDECLAVKRPHLADANLDACLIDKLERAFHRHAPAAALVVGCSASAWAAAVASYFKHVPLIHLGAGVFAPPGERPYPEWFHRRGLAQLARLHLCPDAGCLASLQRMLAQGIALQPPADAGEPDANRKGQGDVEGEKREFDANKARERGPQVPGGTPNDATVRARVVGDGADEALARSLAAAPRPEDPTLKGFRPDAPRVLAFVRRREHHANALRPLCRALDALSLKHPDHDFAVVQSLQSYICDALVALLPRRDNLRDISPLPHPAFVRELARARLVITDSAGTAREALLLGRPLMLIGSYSRTEPLDRLAATSATGWEVVPMELESLVNAASNALGSPAPPPSREIQAAVPTGALAAEAILEWWNY